MTHLVVFIVIGLVLMFVGADMFLDTFRKRSQHWVDGSRARLPRILQVLMSAVLFLFGVGGVLSGIGVNVLQQKITLALLAALIGIAVMFELKRILRLLK